MVPKEDDDDDGMGGVVGDCVRNGDGGGREGASLYMIDAVSLFSPRTVVVCDNPDDDDDDAKSMLGPEDAMGGAGSMHGMGDDGIAVGSSCSNEAKSMAMGGSDGTERAEEAKEDEELSIS